MSRTQGRKHFLNMALLGGLRGHAPTNHTEAETAAVMLSRSCCHSLLRGPYATPEGLASHQALIHHASNVILYARVVGVSVGVGSAGEAHLSAQGHPCYHE